MSGDAAPPQPEEPARRSGRSLGLASAAISTVMAIVYTTLVTGQGERPLGWVLAVLLGASVLAILGSRPGSSHRLAALLTAGTLLLGLGFLALFSIGLPIMLAGLLALLAALRGARR